MKFTLGWLKDHLETNAPLPEITDTLTSLGLELESVEDRAATFADFKVAYVEKADKHPDADRLKVLLVDTGKEKLQVVCGAPNARAGMKGIFAPDGSYVPGTGVTLKKGVIRGQESNGMMVSEREMGLSDEHNGIIEVDEKYAIGTPFAEVYGLNDPVIDISVTPNRADCAGVRGIARDLAATGIGELKAIQNNAPVKGAFKSPVTVSIADEKACPIYYGCYVRGVTNGVSTDDIQNKIKAAGARPISALVDITNCVTFDHCRPLHVFDADKLKGNIHVRGAKKGETMEALNDKTYTLDEGITVICDDSGVIAIAGIIGGKATGCTAETKNVFIECAVFDTYLTAKTGRALDIISDARYRNERGLDPEFAKDGITIAANLVQQLCGGEASEIVVAGNVPNWKRTISFDPAYTAKLAGLEIDENQQKDILQTLGFTIEGNKAPYTVTPPSWRADVEGEADLVEEVARVFGFDNIPPLQVRSDSAVSNGGETDNFARSRKARAALATRGLYECVTWSFMKKETARLFGSNDNPTLTLSNPISSELSQMRPSILPNLIEAAQRNADRGYSNAALFEVGPAFTSAKVDGQKTVAAGIRQGAKGSRHWSGTDASRNVDALDAKADALAALEAVGAPAGNLQVSRDAPEYYHPGRSGALRLGANVLAYFGEIHPSILEEMGVRGPMAAFEVFVNNAPTPKNKGSAKPLVQLSAFQPVQRDFAFLVDDSLEADSLMRAARSADKMIEKVEIFDIYKGKGVEDGKKSVAINVIIQPKDKTLTEADFDSLNKKIIETVTAKCNATLRG
jgi:phenylalanyl-tRNA synthetase beta chain